MVGCSRSPLMSAGVCWGSEVRTVQDGRATSPLPLLDSAFQTHSNYLMVTFKKDAGGAGSLSMCETPTAEAKDRGKLRTGTEASFLFLGKSLPPPAGGEVPSGALRVVNFLSQTPAKLGTPRARVGESGVQRRYGAEGVGTRVMRSFSRNQLWFYWSAKKNNEKKSTNITAERAH